MRIHTLDLRFQGQPGIIASYLVECDGGLALIETGPGSTLPALLEQISSRGFDLAAIRDVFVTHIHLDHSGAAGWWAGQGATIYAHSRARQHLVDPSKLIDSARRVYRERMDSLWGDVLPVPEGQVRVLEDGEVQKVGKMEIRALDTPGHARHHLAFVIGDVCFTGDVAGVRLQGCPYISVAAAPPQFDPVAYGESIERLHSMNLAKIYLTHFGEVSDVGSHLSDYALHVEEVHEAMEGFIDEGLSGKDLYQAFELFEHEAATRAGASEEQWRLFQLANPTSMCADGIALFIQKQREGAAK